MLAGFHWSWSIYFYCALGVVISVVLPILRAMLPKPPPGLTGEERGIGPVALSYLALGAFSLVAAVLIVFSLGDTLADPRAALLAGYTCDSTLQKLKPFR